MFQGSMPVAADTIVTQLVGDARAGGKDFEVRESANEERKGPERSHGIDAADKGTDKAGKTENFID
jgi:hypothetical protein